MAQPIWLTPAGSLGVIPESVFYQQTMYAYDPDGGEIYYRVIAGKLPEGIQCEANGVIAGTPKAIASLQGVPTPVNRDVTSKFVLRVYTEDPVTHEVLRLSDRTFSLTVTGNDVPTFVTPAGSLGNFYDSDEVDIQILYTDVDPNETVTVRLASGQLPMGLTLSSTGQITGYIAPPVNVDQLAGYDLTPIYSEPYDFVVSAQNKNYEFTLEVTDGKTSDLRTFSMFVYDRESFTADTTEITGDTTVITADETPIRPPFLLNGTPIDLGVFRSNNFFAYQFRGFDYDYNILKYSISVNQGAGLPPGLTLDPNSGYYYGFVPDQGLTAVDYSFNIVVYQADSDYDVLTCTATTAGTNTITCNDTSVLTVNTPVVFSGTVFGTVVGDTVYYVQAILSSTEFCVALTPGAVSAINLLSDTGSMTAQQVICSRQYPFTLSVIGDIDAEVFWITDSDLGTMANGEISTLVVRAETRGGNLDLKYRLKSGGYNQLPQGLELLPSGEISGQVSFNTFAVDGGTTTFDATQSNITGISETTFDSEFEFTVNAYAEDTGQLLYNVKQINVVNGGSGYSNINPPSVVISSPVGATADTAQAGVVTLQSGAITAVAVADQGSGYIQQATVTVTQGYGGTGAVLEAEMQATGIRDAVSVFKTFVVKVLRRYNAPYQNIVVEAMPPPNDRELIDSLLDNTNIFVPEFIYRPDDPYFGKANRVTYQHAFGLSPVVLDLYVESLYLNHYWKNLVLGSVKTAQALDANGNVLYEVVYSQIVDDLVNDQGQSVAKIVNLPYVITDPGDNSTLVAQVYPNSLINMRDQVIDVVGQISTALPLWMTSKQKNGRVLGFTPAWVLCYTKPGRSDQIAYYLQQQFGQQLNKIDFKVDRYVLNTSMSRNWNPVTQMWTPTPNLTTFDRYTSTEQRFIGYVSFATLQAFADINTKTLAEIAAIGGIDGAGVVPDNGNTLIFVKQELYPSYATTNQAWQRYNVTYDSGPFSPATPGNGFDDSDVVAAGYSLECTATSAATDRVTCSSTAELREGDPVWFTGAVFGGIVTEFGGTTKVYYILSIDSATEFTLTEDEGSPTPVALTTATGTMYVNGGNDRMGIWTINIDPATTQVTLTLHEKTAQNQYVTVSRGTQFTNNKLFYATSPPPGLSRVNWQSLPLSNTTETIFDEGSMAFEEPVDMYDPTDQYDKYLVFPKTNILE